ncbi:hypothetical protein CHARACLAT_018313 [Characodon lateralis]|uniref:Uncharacterized protein n=1 Tax=Characodon lateralis TaxID=208331 RepID=A0ABU7DTK5_9TELE|nr:hypothetical protein [Characodon lateralis]
MAATWLTNNKVKVISIIPSWSAGRKCSFMTPVNKRDQLDVAGLDQGWKSLWPYATRSLTRSPKDLLKRLLEIAPQIGEFGLIPACCSDVYVPVLCCGASSGFRILQLFAFHSEFKEENQQLLLRLISETLT